VQQCANPFESPAWLTVRFSDDADYADILGAFMDSTGVVRAWVAGSGERPLHQR
jgi:hypothetical protein